MLPWMGTAGASSAYQISRSLRFRNGNSAYLNRTPGVAGDRTKWTWSGWLKRSALSTGPQGIFGCGSSASDSDYLYAAFNSGDQLIVSGGVTTFRISNALFRDSSAWFHLVIAVDTNASGVNKIRAYMNGSELSWATASTPGPTLGVNQVAAHYHGRRDTSDYAGLMLAEVHFVDGQQLDPASFGQFDAVTGVWSPKRYAGTFGPNGFKINFSDNSNTTAVTLGADTSGSGNNWTPNNMSVAAGANNDSLVDTPTSYGTDTGAGGEVRGNYATFSGPALEGNGIALANGNLEASSTAASKSAIVPFEMRTGKWAIQFKQTVSANHSMMVGVCNVNHRPDKFPGETANSWSFWGYSGQKYTNGSPSSFGLPIALNDIVTLELDADNNSMQVFVGNTSQGTMIGMVGPYFFCTGNGSGESWTIVLNAGQRGWETHMPTSGYKALCSQNFPEPAIKKPNSYFDANTRAGTGSAGGVTGKGFQPGIVWSKSLAARSHMITDAARGVGIYASSDSTLIETSDAQAVTAFNAGGFSFGTSAILNASGESFVDWLWAAATSKTSSWSGSPTANMTKEVYSALSGVSALTFSTIVSLSQTVGHSLGVAPSLVVVKDRSSGAWNMFHASLGGAKYILLNSTAAAVASSTRWNDTAPTSTVITLGSSFNGATNCMAIAFSEVAEFSKFGSYAGNGSADGPFVWCGFKPRFVLAKRTDTASANANWYVYDTVRQACNVMNVMLLPDLSNAQSTTSSHQIDITSKGFKIRATGDGINASGGAYIFAAFAESPSKYARAA